MSHPTFPAWTKNSIKTVLVASLPFLLGRTGKKPFRENFVNDNLRAQDISSFANLILELGDFFFSLDIGEWLFLIFGLCACLAHFLLLPFYRQNVKKTLPHKIQRNILPEVIKMYFKFSATQPHLFKSLNIE